MNRVKVEYPLKQGLKLKDYRNFILAEVVKVEYPLKQGLKPDFTLDNPNVVILLK